MRQVSKIILFSLLFIIISACSPSIEEEQEVTKELVETVFKDDEKIETNNKIDNAKFYLPSSATVKDTTNNNIIFEKGSKVFILFSNLNESAKSDVVYKSSKSSQIDYIINDTFEDDEKFGYLLAHEIEDEVYELIVGVGGVKVTTESDVKHLSADAELMMEIAASFEYK